MERAAGIVVVRYFDGEPKILLLRVYGKWDLPKGRIEKHESTYEAARRETFEEAGIDSLKFDWGLDAIQVNNCNSRRQKTVTMFVARTEQDPEIKPNPETGRVEHHGASWVSFDHAIKKVHPYLAPTLKWACARVLDKDHDAYTRWRNKKSEMVQEAYTAKLETWYATDMRLAINWAQLNDVIVSSSEVKKNNDRYYSDVKLKVNKQKFEELMKNRFGMYIKVI